MSAVGTGGTRLDGEAYDAAVERESARFSAVLAGAPLDAAVPSCPEWTAADLAHHLAEVQAFWTAVVRDRLAEPDEAEAAEPERVEDPRPVARGWSAALVEALAAARDDEPVWTWADDRSVGFVRRRQAHEALVHRVDAELTAGAERAPVDPLLAADGVDEALRVMFGGVPGWAEFAPDDGAVRLECTDTGAEWVVVTGRFRGTNPRSGRTYDEPALEVLDETGASSATAPVAVVRAQAALLDLWLWGREPRSVLAVEGDEAAVDRLAGVVAAGVQ